MSQPRLFIFYSVITLIGKPLQWDPDAFKFKFWTATMIVTSCPSYSSNHLKSFPLFCEYRGNDAAPPSTSAKL